MAKKDSTVTWDFTYNPDGLRLSRSNGTTTYSYVYNGSQLTAMTVDSNVLYFSYNAAGAPMSVNFNDTEYFYTSNIQGDVIGIVDATGTTVVTYTYDAWGNILSTTDTTTNNLGTINPLRYRGYIYDQESGLYYLQSRYYDPNLGRFINGDNYPTTGQGFTGNNMYAYCGNNPVIRIDASGEFFFTLLGAGVGAVVGAFDAVMTGSDIRKGIAAGAASGAISGAGIDLAVVVTASTGGAGMPAAVAIAGSFGAVGSVVGTGISSDWQAEPIDYIGSALVGAGTNMLSLGLAPINGEIVSKGVVPITKDLMQNGLVNIGENLSTGGIIAFAATWITRLINGS